MVGAWEHQPQKGCVQPCVKNAMYKFCGQKGSQNVVYRFCHQPGPSDSSRCATTAKFHSFGARVFLDRSRRTPEACSCFLYIYIYIGRASVFQDAFLQEVPAISIFKGPIGPAHGPGPIYELLPIHE